MGIGCRHVSVYIYTCLPFLEIRNSLRSARQSAGDSFEVRRYSRLAALRVGQRVLPEVSMAQRGDCLVAFSRKDVHQMKREVEGKGQHSCCVVSPA